MLGFCRYACGGGSLLSLFISGFVIYSLFYISKEPKVINFFESKGINIVEIRSKAVGFTSEIYKKTYNFLHTNVINIFNNVKNIFNNSKTNIDKAPNTEDLQETSEQLKKLELF